jgi:glycosyltransferase involved in cell wall biosynthesis
VKKILYVHHGKGLGGAPLSLLYLIEGINKKEYYPIVLFLYNSEIIDLYKSKEIEVVGPVNLSDFPHTKIWWLRWYHFFSFIRVIKDTVKTMFWEADYWLKKIQPDLVHLNTSSLIAWGRGAAERKIPVVWHIREPLSPGYFGLRRKIVVNFVRKYSSVILPICKNDSVHWKGEEKKVVVYNSVRKKQFNSSICGKRFLQEQDISSAVPTILFLGGLSQEKGTSIILSIFEHLLKLMPNIQLLIAGYFDIEKKKRTPLLKQFFPAATYKRKVFEILKRVKSHVHLLGAITRVPEAMAASDVIVFPATVGHFARPVIEAGFMKKPVVASRLPPLDELVKHEKTGFLVNSNDIYEWAKVLKILLKDESLRKSMGENALKFCKHRFCLDEQIKKVENIYKKLI